MVTTMPLVHSFLEHFAIIYPGLVILLTVYGFLRCSVAWALGDNTARECGVLSLNPLKHVEPIGLTIWVAVLSIWQLGGFWPMVAMSMLFAATLFGIFPYYSPPINSHNLYDFKIGVVVVTLLCICSYFLISVLGGLLGVWFLSMGTPLANAVGRIMFMVREWSFFWGLLALLPIPPFELSALWSVLFGQEGQRIYNWLEDRSLIIILGIMVVHFFINRGAGLL